MKARSAISAINRHGIILVYPIDNQSEPISLWSHFFPRNKMLWEWDDEGDSRVAALWHLREELSRSQEVIYAKWFRGRATFFSREVFVAMLSHFLKIGYPPEGVSQETLSLLSILEENSPCSTKELKKISNLQGKFFQSTYEKSLRELWRRLLVVGFGEIDDGAFPSLAIGSSRLLFEDLWHEASEQNLIQSKECLRNTFDSVSPFLSYFEKVYRLASSPNEK